MRIDDTGNGITKDSLAFYRDHRHRIGDVREVNVRFPGYDDPHDPYLLVLRDGDGNELRLSGCTTGYVGEGPHGSMRVLIEEGVPVAHAMVVLSAATARFVRDRDGWMVADYTLAHTRPAPSLTPPAAREPAVRAAGADRC